MHNNPPHNEALQLRKAIERLLDSGRPFALFRYPNADDVELILQTEGEAHVVQNNEDLLNGFIFAPFHETADCPTLLIHPDVHLKGRKAITNEMLTPHNETEHRTPETTRHADTNENGSWDGEHYAANFNRTHAEILSKRLQKSVLAYCQKESGSKHLLGKEADVFLRALEAYPNSMVSLAHTAQSGTWMGSTPELLLKRNDEQWQTMALAGTRVQDTESWDEKNLQEQDVVTRYIETTLRHMGANIQFGQTTTMHTGNLLHIRTDVSFGFPHPQSTVAVLHTLHPTPAVCGIPKEMAFRHILDCEGESRRYFSGYLGVIYHNHEAHLYVNLRCAEICQHATYYHAGGGITALSQLSTEAQEIQRKLDTLKNLC